MGTLSALGEAINSGVLPNLASLTIWHTPCEYYGDLDPADLNSLLLQMCTAADTKLRSLCLGEVYLSTESDRHIAAAVKNQSGALSRLEELSLHNLDCPAVLEALGQGAPCAQTLQCLRVTGDWIPWAGIRHVLERLRKGSFPRLKTLVLRSDSGAFLPSVLEQLGDALHELAGKGTPSVLEELQRKAPRMPIAYLVKELTGLFKAGALPCLRSLEFGARRAAADGPDDRLGDGAAFVAEWTALGGRIGIEQLRLDASGLSPAFEANLLGALEDPAFCPRLRVASLYETPSGSGLAATRAALEERRRRWEARARGVEGVGGPEALGASEARVAALER